MSTTPQYKWPSPHAWLLSQAEHWPADMLFRAMIDLALKHDADTIQDLFQTFMEEDGYFEPIKANGEKDD